MKALAKQIQLFLVREDERDISIALRELRPQIGFLDGNVWDAALPELVPSIDTCRQCIRFVHLNLRIRTLLVDRDFSVAVLRQIGTVFPLLVPLVRYRVELAHATREW